jgi:nitroreductase/NAD-dependent dihydropyrimidine dehydrogenase PreA subunit
MKILKKLKMITIDKQKCTDCRKCFDICPNYVFSLKNNTGNKKTIELRYPEQCCVCGHCIAICQTRALSHENLPFNSIIPVQRDQIEPESIEKLLVSRRSVRNYKQKPVPEEMLRRLLEIAVHSGSSSNGQTEEFIVIRDQKKLRELELLVIDALWNAGLKFLNSGFMKTVMKKIYGNEVICQYEAYHNIIKHRREHNEQEGMIFRNAPAVIVVYGIKTNFLAQTNCALAIRNIEILAETMGLGTCWVGFLPSAANKSKKINKFLQIPGDKTVLASLMLGFPKYTYRYKLPRKERCVSWL